MSTDVETVELGASGEQVQEMQARLKHLGFFHGEVDGEFRDDTDAALREFQRQHGKEESGQATAETFEALDLEAQYAGYDAFAVRQNGYRVGSAEAGGAGAGHEGEHQSGNPQVGYEQDGYADGTAATGSPSRIPTRSPSVIRARPLGPTSRPRRRSPTRSRNI